MLEATNWGIIIAEICVVLLSYKLGRILQRPPNLYRSHGELKYVRNFEREEYLLPNTWIIVRIDGRGFHKLSTHYNFVKPNDSRALNLMNAAAEHVMRVLPDVVLAYGYSDEYSFAFHRSCSLFERRSAKIASTVVSSFTSAYIHLWPSFFALPPEDGTFFHTKEASDDAGNMHVDPPGGLHRSDQLDLAYLPTFDARCIAYPSDQNFRDYFSWRQADCHINNLYNTSFWALVLKGGMSNADAEEHLKGTVSSDKNEILWASFGINYNNEREIFKKGSIVSREYQLVELTQGIKLKSGPGASAEDNVIDEHKPISKTHQEKTKKARQKARIITQNIDLIKDDFWIKRPWLLNGGVGEPIP